MSLEDVKLRGELKEEDNMREFVKRILTEKDLDIKDTDYYRTQKRTREHKWSIEKLDKYLEEKRDLIIDIAKNGIQKPITLDKEGRVVDGLHRYMVAKHLDQKSIIVR